MDIQKVRKAQQEAKEFVERAEAIIQIAAARRREFDAVCDHPVETGALRRQSMELTRALAKMRRP